MGLKVAVVGMGGIGTLHARAYAADPRAELVAVCDQAAPAAERAAQAFGVPRFASVAELLASGIEIDAASLCTSGAEKGSDHYEPTMELLRAGVPVLGEKPISNDLAQAREMVAYAAEHGIPYAINLNHRFTPAAERAKSWLQSGRLGELHMCNLTMWIGNPDESSPHVHMRALHPHSIDVMRWFCGDIEAVQAFFKKGPGRTVWTNVQANLLFAGGAVGHLTGSYDAAPSYGMETCELVGSEGRAVIKNAAEELAFYPRRSTEVEVYEHPGGMGGFMDTFGTRIAAWLADLEAKTPPAEVDGKASDALAAQVAIEACIESFERREVVEVGKCR